jgi:hypothetical protein
MKYRIPGSTVTSHGIEKKTQTGKITLWFLTIHSNKGYELGRLVATMQARLNDKIWHVNALHRTYITCNE